MQQTLCATTGDPAARFALPRDMQFHLDSFPGKPPLWSATERRPPEDSWAVRDAALHKDRNPLAGSAR